jgi:hypothetical protein
MRILVATLYSGESEFDECVASIRRQTYRNFHHEVISHLPKKRAHEALFKTFMDSGGDFGLMVKIDADMVLARDDFFQALVSKFDSSPLIEVIGVAVHDFYSDQLIQGLNAYRRGIVWPGVDDLFTDFMPVGTYEIHLDADELAPAAYHCPDPSDIQSFHYGVQRALKVIQPGRRTKRPSYAKSHWETLERVRQNFLLRKDRRIGIAVLGAELAFRGGFGVEHLDYCSPVLGKALRRYSNFDAQRIAADVRRLRTFNFGWLPSRIRRDALRYFRGGNMLDRTALLNLVNSIRWR